jgi:hypothetical protein
LPDVDESIDNHKQTKQREINVRQSVAELQSQEPDGIDDKQISKCVCKPPQSIPLISFFPIADFGISQTRNIQQRHSQKQLKDYGVRKSVLSESDNESQNEKQRTHHETVDGDLIGRLLRIGFEYVVFFHGYIIAK